MNGGSLGSAILMAAVIRRRLAELAALPPLKGRRVAKRLAAASEPPDCPVCDQVADSMASAVDQLATLTADPEWRTALEAAEFCLDDLLLLWRAATRSSLPAEAWESIGQAQLARIGALGDRLEAFAHHHSHDRLHLMTDDERAATRKATRFLGGAQSGDDSEDQGDR